MQEQPQAAANSIPGSGIPESSIPASEEVIIPLAAEEAVVSTQEIIRGVVRVHKRVETQTETLDAALTAEEVTVERVTVNAFVEGDAPQIREEDGVIVIPVLEEVLVVEKRLLLREEVRLTKRATTATQPQTVTLRRESVAIERSGPPGQPGQQGPAQAE